MCCGCNIKLRPDSKLEHDYSYLDMLGEYHAIIWKMKALNKTILDFEQDIIDRHQKSVVSRFRRKLIRLRKEVGKADTILNGVYDK